MVGRLEQFVRGFTLVEMISVLVILGAISALVMSRLSDTGAFDERLARDQLLLIARTAHQLGFSRSSVDLYFDLFLKKSRIIEVYYS